MVTGNFIDGAMHLMGDPSVGRMPGRLAAQLDQVEGLPGVHLHDEAHVEGERHHVLGHVGPEIAPSALRRR